MIVRCSCAVFCRFCWFVVVVVVGGGGGGGGGGGDVFCVFCSTLLKLSKHSVLSNVWTLIESDACICRQ